MAEYVKRVREVLKSNGCRFIRKGGYSYQIDMLG